MKKGILVLATVALLCNQAGAWEFSRNPDRFPSIGVNLSTDKLTGDRSESSHPGNGLNLTYNGDSKLTNYSVGGDVRLPMSDSATLTLSMDYLTTDSRFVRQDNVYDTKDYLKGYRLGISLRSYFNQ